MLALLLAFGLFLFLTVLGKAALEALHFRESILRSWLLAPSIGLAIVVLLVLNLNQAGLPVKSFASWLTLALTLFIAAVFWWKRPVIPWKQLGLFLGVAFFSLAYTCWPMLLYGFRWVGYMNGDMGTYCLGALRAMNYGFYRIPTLTELTGTDYSQYWWFHYAVGLFRCGADLFLAWVSSVVHTQPLRISMPVLGALSLSQLFTAAALILTLPRNRRLALMAASLLAMSPFFALGVLTQLAPQGGGLTLLLGLCVLSMRPLAEQSRWALVRQLALITIISSALCIYYPEVLPIAVLSTIAYHGLQVIRGSHDVRRLLLFMFAVAAPLLILARQSIFTAVGTILFAFSAGVRIAGGQPVSTDFDTMLDPSLFASIFGIAPYYGPRPQPWISLMIFLGICFLAVVISVCLRQCLKGEPPAFLLFTILALGLVLFFTNSAFSLFKLTMYGQSVLAFPLAVGAMRLPKKISRAAPLLYLALTLTTALTYVAKSTLFLTATSITLPGLPEADIDRVTLKPNESILVDTPNMAGDYVFAASAVGADVRWTDSDVFRGFSQMATLPAAILPLPSEFGFTKDYLLPARSLRASIHLSDSTESILGHRISIVRGSRENVTYLGHLTADPWHVSNNHYAHQHDRGYFTFEKMADVRNRLILLSSDKGGPHFRSGVISRWPVEPDWHLPNRTFYAVGRYLLFEVINPTPNLRLRMSFTRTLNGEGRTLLPESALVSDVATERLPFVGNGSANIISPPLRPIVWRGRSYFAVDLGLDGILFPNRKAGLMRLFNIQIPYDPRRVVGFARDISLIDEPEYTSLARPKAINSWPKGLLDHAGLEYSGIYEDGWVSSRAFLVLGKNMNGERLSVEASMPALSKFRKTGNDLRVFLNGDLIYANRVKPGIFRIERVLKKDASQNRIDFIFGDMDKLPPGDDRPVAAQLLKISVQR